MAIQWFDVQLKVGFDNDLDGDGERRISEKDMWNEIVTETGIDITGIQICYVQVVAIKEVE